jgi:hypothetical protein
MRKGFPLAVTLVIVLLMAGAVPICADAACVSPPAGLLSWWGGDNNTLDIVGTNNGTIHGGINYGQGAVGRAFNIDGASGSYLQIPYSADLNIQGSRSISAWVYIRNTGGTRLIAGKAGGTQLYSADGILYFVVYSGVTPYPVISTVPLPGNSWHHVAGVFDGSAGESRIYIDGDLNNTATSIPGLPETYVEPYEIGGFSAFADNLEGLIDEVTIFNQALTGTDVQNIYNAGSAGMCRPCTAQPSNLVAWWGGDNNALDIIGTNNGTLMGNAAYGPGMVGRAFSFDGAESSYVEIPSTAALNPGGAFSVDGWFYIDPVASGNTGEIATLVAKTEGSTGDGWALYFDDRWSTKSLKFVLGTILEIQNAVPAADWYHIAAVYDPLTSPNSKLYINGALAAHVDCGGATPNNFNVRIGAMHWTDSYHQGNDRLNGKADEVEFFNRALSASEIATIYNAGSAGICRPSVAAPSGLISWWKGENNALDVMGLNNGTGMNGLKYASGKVGQAFSFDGTDDYVEVPHSASLNLTSGLTLGTWFNLRSADALLFSKGDSNGSQSDYSYGLAIMPDGSINLALYGTYPADWWQSAAGLVTTGQWHHVATTWDGTYGPSNNVKLYLNGALVQTWTKSLAPLNVTNQTLTLGSMKPPTYYHHMDGLIDEVTIFDRALTADEIAIIYNAGGSGMTPIDTTPDSFTFTDQAGMPLSTSIVSNPITVTGINYLTPISITACTNATCEYKINSGSWTADAGKVTNGDTVIVRQTSSASYSTMTTATLTIGGVSGTFTVTTLADTEKPVVTAFTLHTAVSSAMSVIVDTYIATDNDRVSGYLVTDTATPPVADDAGWSATTPATVTLATAGDNILRAWAKDPAGNVSNPLTATVLLKPVRREPENDYVSLQTAYGEAGSGETIRALAVTLPENIGLNQPRDISISGGYEDGFAGQSGYSTISGSLTVGKGTLTVKRMVIK